MAFVFVTHNEHLAVYLSATAEFLVTCCVVAVSVLMATGFVNGTADFWPPQIRPSLADRQKNLSQVITLDRKTKDFSRSHVIYAVLWCCWLGGRNGIWPVKYLVVGTGMVICMGRGADLHMAHCHSLSLASVKSRLVLVLAHPRPWNRLSWPLTVDLRQLGLPIHLIDQLDFQPFWWLRSTQGHGDRLDWPGQLYRGHFKGKCMGTLFPLLMHRNATLL